MAMFSKESGWVKYHFQTTGWKGNATVILVDIVSHTNQETCTRREKDESRCTQNGLADGSFIK